MNAINTFQFIPHRLLYALAALLIVTSAPAQTTRPTISDIRVEATNVVVEATVPAGLRKVTLECRTHLGRGAWEPRAVARLDGNGGTVRFHLPRRAQFEAVRVRADVRDPLPASFYKGTNSFTGEPSGSGNTPDVYVTMRGDDMTTPEATSPSRDVVESDIWRIRNDTLYFFNTYRGLQVINLANPDSPVLTGTLALPAAGEDLYVLENGCVVLLARDGCGGSTGTESMVLTVSVSGGTPTEAARLKLNGHILESRMVGTALYVATQTYLPKTGTGGTTWEWGTLVSSFDLADPAAPIARDSIWLTGYGNVVTATDKYFFVSLRDPAIWNYSVVRIFDITSPDGVMNEAGSVRTTGYLKDKFKINYSGTTLTTIAEVWTNGRTVTKLETWRLPDPRSLGPLGIVKLGQVELGRGETLHATRFDGNRCYIVTFFRIDPLWIVDLSDPAHPRITGELEVPGWSTYIQPLGDRLVAVGVETNRVAVSLFDVSDPARPALASKVTLGENYSWSEANADEKALTVLPGAGLILVPYSGNTTDGWSSQVQLIDLKRDDLVKRGIIEHQFQPRRATLHQDRVLSLSGWELLSVDATDRDHPVVKSDTTLAWPVDRVFVEGTHLLELATSSTWWGSGQPTLRVVSTAHPNKVLTSLALGEWPVVGATARDGKLYLAQGQSSGWGVVPLAEGDEVKPVPPNFKLTILDVSQLPDVTVLGSAEAVLDSWWGGEWEALWPSEDTLVWSGGANNYWWRGGWLDTPVAGGDLMVADRVASPYYWPWWDGQGGRLLAFDVSDETEPLLASDLTLSNSDWWNFSTAFTAGGLVYLSHSATQWYGELEDKTLGPVRIPPGKWLTRYFLDVVDYADATSPTVRKPVNIAGALTGLSHDGNVVYTLGQHFNDDGLTDWYTQYLDALAYDGVSAHLVDSLALSNTWPRPVLVAGDHIFIGRPSSNNGVIYPGPIVALDGTTDDSAANPPVAPPTLETWALADTGKFTRLGSVPLVNPASALLARGKLLAAQQSDNTVALFDITNPASLDLIGTGSPGGCTWFDLTHADGTIAGGLWLPLGSYGAALIPTKP